MTEKTPSLDEWDDFSGEFLKTDLVKFPVQLAVVDLKSEFIDGKARMFMHTEHNGRKWKLDLNKTNQTFIRNMGLKPRDIIGKVLTFESVKVRNPTSGKQVDSFLLNKIK